MFTVKFRVGESKYAIIRAFDRFIERCKTPLLKAEWLKELHEEAQALYDSNHIIYRVRFPEMNADGNWPENEQCFSESYLCCKRVSASELKDEGRQENDIVYRTVKKQTVRENNTYYAYLVRDANTVNIYTDNGWIDITDDYNRMKDQLKGDVRSLLIHRDTYENIAAQFEFKNQIVHFWSRQYCRIYSFFHTLDSIWLCLRFPFLYPRNRFTDNHYDNWKIINKCKEIASVNNKFYTIIVPEFTTDIPYVDTAKASVICDEDETTSAAAGSPDKKSYYLNEDSKHYYLIDGSHYRPVWDNGKMKIYTLEYGWLTLPEFTPAFMKGSVFWHEDRNEYVWYWEYVHSKFLDMKRKALMSLNRLLSIFCCIPTFSEIDSMDEGWRRRFGLEMLRVLKKELRKAHMLRSYRILQIKEKYGSLRWYDNGSTENIIRIINDYESLSARTCIVCGKPARYITSGWICPYCEEHIDEYSKVSATVIDEDGNVIYDPYADKGDDCASTESHEPAAEDK